MKASRKPMRLCRSLRELPTIRCLDPTARVWATLVASASPTGCHFTLQTDSLHSIRMQIPVAGKALPFGPVLSHTTIVLMPGLFESPMRISPLSH
jgi:hypothetical protein